jgi:hypothetical protein
MAMLREWISRLCYLGRRSRFEGELDDEIRFLIETRAADLEEAGLSRSGALAQARREFGSVSLVREDSRAAWQFQWLEDLAADLRYCPRAFSRSPAFIAVALSGYCRLTVPESLRQGRRSSALTLLRCWLLPLLR